MVTGSVASSMQGEPRLTHDIDMVVAIEESKSRQLTEAFALPDFYLDGDSIIDAIKNHGMFNLINSKTSDKVDFWILTNEPFDQSRFSRRITEEFMGVRIKVSSPEDTILAKLRWAKLSGGSEKQFIDALRVYEVQFGQLDVKYLQDWVTKLKVQSLWKQLTDEAKIT